MSIARYVLRDTSVDAGAARKGGPASHRPLHNFRPGQITHQYFVVAKPDRRGMLGRSMSVGADACEYQRYKR